jgi:hypothetical protein
MLQQAGDAATSVRCCNKRAMLQQAGDAATSVRYCNKRAILHMHIVPAGKLQVCAATADHETCGRLNITSE